MPEQLIEPRRENWGSRSGFVLAAIGSAVGLGNLWGFPYKVYAHGGGAFLIPYVLAMLLIGIPLLILEFSLGHMTQRAAPDALRGINRRTEPIGWWGIILGFVIITYYPVILAWCGNYLFYCIKGIFNGGELPWAGTGIEGVQKAGQFFENSFLNVWTDSEIEAGTKPWAFGKLINPISISLVIIWTLMYLCICRGVRLVSKVVFFTVPLPWIMLGILTVRGLTLDGAATGLNFYLDPDFSELAKPETWRWAFGQMFFSMSLAFGVMITYASFLHRKSDINNNATIIGLADIGTSFIAGIAVFATIGAMAFVTRQAGEAIPVTEVVTDGPGLVFVAFPYVLAQLPYSAWFGAVFFIALLTLGIDSGFSITESVLASLVDKTKWSRSWTLIGMSLAGLGLGLFYCTRGGVVWVTEIDEFINQWGGIALLGLLECVVVGWAYRLARLREHANERSDWKIGPAWDIIIRYVAPVLLSALASWSLVDQASSPGGLLYDKWGDDAIFQTPKLIGLIIGALAPVIAIFLSCIHSPGADTHAQHVGQERTGRGVGLLGTLMTIAGIVLVCLGFYIVTLAMQLDNAGNTREIILDGMGLKTVGGCEVPLGLIILAGGAICGLIGLILGAFVVRFGETHDHRPSGLARLAAGGGVITIGAAAGLALPMIMLTHRVINKIEAAPSVPRPELDSLTAPSYVVLAVMLSILVVGLSWCFLRAIKAAGSSKIVETQLSEGVED